MAVKTRSFSGAMIVGIFAGLCFGVAGCGRTPSLKPDIPEPQIDNEQKPGTFSYDHKIDPEPGYQGKDIDALAAQLTRVVPQREVYVAAAPVTTSRGTVVVRQYGYYPYGMATYRYGSRYPGRNPDHYLNTVFWGGMGAIIGHQSGHTARGAIIGAGAGHMVDHGGLHGLLTPDTILGGAVGFGIGSISGHGGRGALIGAAAGHLMDDVFRRSW